MQGRHPVSEMREPQSRAPVRLPKSVEPFARLLWALNTTSAWQGLGTFVHNPSRKHSGPCTDDLTRGARLPLLGRRVLKSPVEFATSRQRELDENFPTDLIGMFPEILSHYRTLTTWCKSWHQRLSRTWPAPAKKPQTTLATGSHASARPATKVESPNLLQSNKQCRLSNDAVEGLFEFLRHDFLTVACEFTPADAFRALSWFLSGPHYRHRTVMPNFAELISDRWALLTWYFRHRGTRDKLMCLMRVNSVTSNITFGSAGMQQKINVFRQDLDTQLAQIWPLVLDFLLTPGIRRRLEVSARLQIMKRHNGEEANLQSPGRLIRLYNDLLRILFYCWRWSLNEVGLVPLVLSKQKRQCVRIQLIEQAIFKAIELQRAVNQIEAEAKRAQLEQWEARLPLNKRIEAWGLSQSLSTKQVERTKSKFASLASISWKAPTLAMTIPVRLTIGVLFLVWLSLSLLQNTPGYGWVQLVRR